MLGRVIKHNNNNYSSERIRSNNNNNNHYELWGRSVLGAIGVYKRKEIPPPILGGRLFETISGYFPNPAITFYYIRTLHFVECRLCR